MPKFRIRFMPLLVAIAAAGFGRPAAAELSQPIDPTAPTVRSSDPGDGARLLDMYGMVTATFSEAMDPATITAATFTLKNGPDPVPGAVTLKGAVATFAPTGTLSAQTSYTATITTGARDLAGHGLAAPFRWSFRARTASDTNRPRVSSTVPVQAATGVTVGTRPTATFSERMVRATITEATFTLRQGPDTVAGTVSSTDTVAIFAPSDPLRDDAVYTASISNGVRDLAGNGPAATFTWTFTTGTASAAGPRPVAAVADMAVAYADAAGRTAPDVTDLNGGEIDGMNLGPGLYRWRTGVLIPTGVTLAGKANDVWIFQIANNLTVADGATVTLSGGAQARNVFWQVGGKVIIGATATFEGTILSRKLVTMNSGTAPTLP
jgi:hypothetical protein